MPSFRSARRVAGVFSNTATRTTRKTCGPGWAGRRRKEEVVQACIDKAGSLRNSWSSELARSPLAPLAKAGRFTQGRSPLRQAAREPASSTHLQPIVGNGRPRRRCSTSSMQTSTYPRPAREADECKRRDLFHMATGRPCAKTRDRHRVFFLQSPMARTCAPAPTSAIRLRGKGRSSSSSNGRTGTR